MVASISLLIQQQPPPPFTHGTLLAVSRHNISRQEPVILPATCLTKPRPRAPPAAAWAWRCRAASPRTRRHRPGRGRAPGGTASPPHRGPAHTPSPDR